MCIRDRGYSVLFTTSVDLLTNIRKRIKEPNLRDLARYAIDVDLLILDDFGAVSYTHLFIYMNKHRILFLPLI